MGAIGIVGGVGPYAGTDLVNKVFAHTKANKDQKHIDLYLVSCPALIPDRTDYLLNNGANPASGMEECMNKLAQMGSSAIGIGCNTAHSPKILSQIKFPKDVEFINMIEETCNYVSSIGGSIEKPFKVGLLATLGTIKTGIYKQYFDKHEELELVLPSNKTCEKVHDAIYNKEYGIKAVSPVSAIANKACRVAVDELSLLGCKAVILGCTELPLVFSGQKEYNNTVLVDPTDILAQRLVKAVAPEKFKA